MTIWSDIQAFKTGDNRQRLVILMCITIISISSLSFIYNGILRSFPYIEEIDLYHFYAAGMVWNEGNNPYDYATFRAKLAIITTPELYNWIQLGYLYPPQTTVLFSFLARLPFDTAHILVVTINSILVLVSLGLLARIIAFFKSIGLIEMTLLSSFLNTGYARATVRIGQLSALIFILLLVSFLFSLKKRQGIAGILLGVVSIKPSFLPLYMMEHFLSQRFKLLLICIITGLLLTVLPLIATQRPIIETLQSFAIMTKEGLSGDVNNASPFYIWSSSMGHLQPLVNRILNQESAFATFTNYTILLSLCIYAAYLIINTGKSVKSQFMNFALVSALSVISLYHRQYDLFLVFPAFICFYIHIRESSNLSTKRLWLGFLAISLALLIVPLDFPIWLGTKLPTLNELYIWRVMAPIQSWVNLLIVAGIIWLKRKQFILERQSWLQLTSLNSYPQ